MGRVKVCCSDPCKESFQIRAPANHFATSLLSALAPTHELEELHLLSAF